MLSLILLLTLCASVPGQYLPVDGVRQPVKGVNLPWFDGAYGHCYGPQAAQPTWTWPYNRSKAEQRFADIAGMHVNVVRIWVFEDYEGVLFEDGRPSGIHPTFLSNLKEAVAIADKNGLNAYLCMFNNVNIKGRPNLYQDQRFRKALLAHVVVPFAIAFKDNPGVFAIDIMNEPEGELNRAPTWKMSRAFLRDCATAIHKTDPNRLVSTGGSWKMAEGAYSSLGFDFYDVHMYSDEGSLPNLRQVRQKMASLGASKRELGMPIIIGECGQASRKFDDDTQRRAVANFLRTAKEGGYAGVLVWCYQFPNVTVDEHRLVRGFGDKSLRPAGEFIRDFRW